MAEIPSNNNNIHHGHDSSSSDSEDERPSTSLRGNKVYRLFGREKPIHSLLGADKPADVLLWRDTKLTATVLGGATVVWLLFDVLEYNLLPLVCQGLILGLAVLFVWSNAAAFLEKSLPLIPEVNIPEEPALKFASALRIEINRAFAGLREIASGRDLKKFLSVIAGLWILAFFGCCCDFLTLFYAITVLLFIVPMLYENYEDEVDSFAEKAIAEIKKQYAVFDAEVLSKIPRGPLKDRRID